VESARKVGIVILNWNGSAHTFACIESLRRSTYPHWEILVVDNGSRDGSPEKILERFPDITLIRNAANLGFAGGNNVGIDAALISGADYVLILNNDTVVHPEMVLELVVAAHQSGDRAVVCPKIYWSGDPTRLWYAGGRVNLWTGRFTNIGRNQFDHVSEDSPAETDFATGCCMLVPRHVLERVGKFDANYFLYCEDVDWSLRCSRAGFRLLCVPRAKLWHVEGGASGGMTTARHYFPVRNGIWTVLKHGHLFQKITCLGFFFPMRVLLGIARMVVKQQWRAVVAQLRGSRDGVLHRIPR